MRLPKSLVERLCDFKIYAISVLSFLGVCTPDKATLKAENHGLQCTTAGPYNTISSKLLEVGSVRGLGPDLVVIHSIRLAARYRVAASSSFLRRGLEKVCRVWHSPGWPCSRSWSRTGDLPWNSRQAPQESGRGGRRTWGRSRETGEERTLKQPNTNAHAWMTWNDTQARLEPQVRCMNACTTTHLNAAHRAQWCAVVTSVWVMALMQLFAMFKLCVRMYAVCRSHLCIVKCSWIWGAGYIPFTHCRGPFAPQHRSQWIHPCDSQGFEAIHFSTLGDRGASR